MKHSVEDRKSWELAVDRGDAIGGEGTARRLKKHHKHHRTHERIEDNLLESSDDGETITDPPRIEVKQKKYNVKKISRPSTDTRHALMIDAGSQGTRIHIYEYERRILYTAEELTEALNGIKLSIPTTNTRWTNRLKPGLDYLAQYQDDQMLQETLISYLGPLLEFAKTVLSDKDSEWHNYPIYLKATGGLRTLHRSDRIRLVDGVRTLFQNKTFNPFNFDDPERVRVIAGEEEAIYGWAAVNFALGTLVKDSEGKGTVLNPHHTWGMLEMGGASTQIAWFENSGDIMANLMKLQIGGARHWNLYAHSFLYFGVNGAWSRLNAHLYRNGKGTTINPCLPTHSSTGFLSWIHYDEEGRPLPRNDPRSIDYNITMSNQVADFDQCTMLTRNLLRKDANKEWVEFSHDGDCSFAGVYQPPLPQQRSPDDEFILTSNYYHVWAFLQLPERASVQAIQDGARRICEMDIQTLEKYNARLSEPADADELYQYCFRATLTFEMLATGYGFPLDYGITAKGVVNGQKLGWALGSTLYEINTLPWEFGGEYKKSKHDHKNNKGIQLLGIAQPEDDTSTFGDARAGFTAALVLGLIMTLAWVVKTRQSRIRNRNYQEIQSNF